MGNVQSLRNKLDELQGMVRFQKDYKDCCVLAFTETWFTERDQDTELAIDGFGAPLRLDRDPETTGKRQGGGVCVYINKTYCSSMTIRDRICTPDIELLSVSLRPFYLPREFPQLFIISIHSPQGKRCVKRILTKCRLKRPCKISTSMFPAQPDGTRYWISATGQL
jgi:hypothetical protein